MPFYYIWNYYSLLVSKRIAIFSNPIDELFLKVACTLTKRSFTQRFKLLLFSVLSCIPFPLGQPEGPIYKDSDYIVKCIHKDNVNVY